MAEAAPLVEPQDSHSALTCWVTHLSSLILHITTRLGEAVRFPHPDVLRLLWLFFLIKGEPWFWIAPVKTPAYLLLRGPAFGWTWWFLVSVAVVEEFCRFQAVQCGLRLTFYVLTGDYL